MEPLKSHKKKKREEFEAEIDLQRVESESDEELIDFPGLDELHFRETPFTTDNEGNMSYVEDSELGSLRPSAMPLGNNTFAKKIANCIVEHHHQRLVTQIILLSDLICK